MKVIIFLYFLSKYMFCTEKQILSHCCKKNVSPELLLGLLNALSEEVPLLEGGDNALGVAGILNIEFLKSFWGNS